MLTPARRFLFFERTGKTSYAPSGSPPPRAVASPPPAAPLLHPQHPYYERIDDDGTIHIGIKAPNDYYSQRLPPQHQPDFQDLKQSPPLLGDRSSDRTLTHPSSAMDQLLDNGGASAGRARGWLSQHRKELKCVSILKNSRNPKAYVRRRKSPCMTRYKSADKMYEYKKETSNLHLPISPPVVRMCRVKLKLF